MPRAVSLFPHLQSDVEAERLWSVYEAYKRVTQTPAAGFYELIQLSRWKLNLIGLNAVGIGKWGWF